VKTPPEKWVFYTLFGIARVLILQEWRGIYILKFKVLMVIYEMIIIDLQKTAKGVYISSKYDG
jgi:hypothetical protein